MQFIADESCDFTIVRALVAEGHDVMAVSQISPRADDDSVLALAQQRDAVLLTEDKDFGRIFYATRRTTSGTTPR